MKAKLSVILLFILSFTLIAQNAHSSIWGEKRQLPVPWPPVEGQAYPDIDLIDQNGKAFKLSDFKGKLIIVEPTAMTCPACQALSGAHGVGSFGDVVPQPGISSIHTFFPIYAGGLKLPRPDIILV